MVFLLSEENLKIIPRFMTLWNYHIFCCNNVVVIMLWMWITLYKLIWFNTLSPVIGVILEVCEAIQYGGFLEEMSLNVGFQAWYSSPIFCHFYASWLTNDPRWPILLLPPCFLPCDGRCAFLNCKTNEPFLPGLLVRTKQRHK